MKKYLLGVACAAALTVLTVGSSVQAQGVFSPSVNGVRSIYQTRRAAAADSAAQRVVVIVTCSADASMAAIANQMTELKAIVRLVMGDQLMVETTIDKLDAIAAIDGVLLIDIPKPGRQRTDKPNPYEAFRVHKDCPEVWKNGFLVDGGKHYGHLEVNISTNRKGRWEATLESAYIFVTTNASGKAVGFERRVYPDVIRVEAE